METDSIISRSWTASLIPFRCIYIPFIIWMFLKRCLYVFAQENDEFSKKQIRDAFNDRATYMSRQLKKITHHQEQIRKVREELKTIRSKTIRSIDMAIKFLNDDSTDVTEIVAKISSALGKFLMFVGPVGTVAGAVISISGDMVNAVSCASRESEKDKHLKAIKCVLEKDARKAKELYHLIGMTRMVCEDIRDCIKHFHAATLEGFYDSLPEFKEFAKSVRKIIDINDSESAYEFLRAVGIVSLEFRKELSLSLSNLLQHHRDALWCAASVLKIAVASRAGISAAMAGAEIGFSAGGTVLKNRVLIGMNVFSIFCDVMDISDKALQYGKKSSVVMQLEGAKRKLQEENREIDRALQKILYNKSLPMYQCYENITCPW